MWMWSWFIVLQILDLATTYWAFQMDGFEQNPLYLVLISQFPGESPIAVISGVKFFGISVLASLAWNQGRAGVIRAANKVYTMIVFWNLYIVSELASRW